ncbi:DUF4190 domain-containing protein [Brevibacterium sp. FAM 24630]|uniref:DUF4190 domain-containing protein n=1 Tax=unclassified Brevibacterium TaxID=2614124 RepID=UPI003C7A84FC
MNAAPTPLPGQHDDPHSGQLDAAHAGQELPPYSQQNPSGVSQTYPGAPQTYPGQPPMAYASRTDPRTEEDPGKVLGIVSLVATLSTFLGFNFLGPVIGIITGHMARKRSQDAGRADNEMGKWGFILGIVFLGLLVLGWVLGISFGLVGGLASLLAG